LNLGGFLNKEVVVDLTAGSINYRPINEEDAKKYIGGRGLGVKYVLDNGPEVEPLSPENMLCIMTGPATREQMQKPARPLLYACTWLRSINCNWLTVII